MFESKFPLREQRSYDFIFLGAGCASLSIIMRMIRSGKFAEKKILLIDKEPKTKNDRTWCFWEKQDGFFEAIVHQKWDTISFLSDSFSSDMNITPYQYKMIRGIDFYRYCFHEIEQQKNIDIFYGEVTQALVHKEGITIHINGEMLNLDHAIIFNSILPKETNVPGTIKLLQHFKGWVIETSQASFDPRKAIFMDFRVGQKDDTTFAYLLPLSKTKALVEYTLFSKEILEDAMYETELKKYVENILQLKEYQVTEKEFGVIPMTNRKFSFYENSYHYNIGTAGGQTKASSGFTFQFILKQSQFVVDSLLKGNSLQQIPSTPKRFRFYDNTLLHILYHRKLQGKEIFSRIFAKNDPLHVLRFLDNESSLTDELKIISTLPALPFLKAVFKQLEIVKAPLGVWGLY
ncbi:MAG TPA: lycopene cyclase family protein [Chitinophagaceae bacterium]|nr:lycopene cyclase family protein [Chitinophagaceae bacterium]